MIYSIIKYIAKVLYNSTTYVCLYRSTIDDMKSAIPNLSFCAVIMMWAEMRLNLSEKKDQSTENTNLFELIASMTTGKSIFIYSFIHASIDWHII